jgi:hypothetical protein
MRDVRALATIEDKLVLIPTQNSRCSWPGMICYERGPFIFIFGLLAVLDFILPLLYELPK